MKRADRLATCRTWGVLPPAIPKSGRWLRGAAILTASLLAASALARACPPQAASRVAIGAQSWRVETAVSEAERQRGLSGRDGLQAGHGLWFVMPHNGRHAFWMRDMRFAIDLVWITPEAAVAGALTLPVCAADPCPVYRPDTAVRYVLELPAGGFQGQSGDTVTWQCGE